MNDRDREEKVLAAIRRQAFLCNHTYSSYEERTHWPPMPQDQGSTTFSPCRLKKLNKRGALQSANAALRQQLAESNMKVELANKALTAGIEQERARSWNEQAALTKRVGEIEAERDRLREYVGYILRHCERDYRWYSPTDWRYSWDCEVDGGDAQVSHNRNRDK